jgi:hypothetical protein
MASGELSICSFRIFGQHSCALRVAFELKRDATFAPRQRPSSWRVSSYVKGARELKIFLAGSWRVVLHHGQMT